MAAIFLADTANRSMSAPPKRWWRASLLVAAVLILSACSSGEQVQVGPSVGARGQDFPAAPSVPTGPMDPDAAAQINAIVELTRAPAGDMDGVDQALVSLGEFDDARIGWFLSDFVRFFPSGEPAEAAADAFDQLTGVELDRSSVWLNMTDHLIAWDLPASPEYVGWKQALFTTVEPRWTPFFEDEDADIDWRELSWGGIFIDDREFGLSSPCRVRGCIPALEDPGVVTLDDGGDWYPDDRIVFGVVVNGEARAYPKNIMEVHEMVNDELGGRRIGIPYCTLCGSVEVYFTDIPEDQAEENTDGFLVLRTSGLLTRSNKVMFDLRTQSVFDTFTGEAVSGPLQDLGVSLEPATVVTSLWGDWKEAHPDTTIIAPDGGIGRIYPEDPLVGRDADGPIFAVGDVDPRLDPQALVLGVENADGEFVAFEAARARTELAGGESIEFAGVTVTLVAGGLVARDSEGRDLGAGESFWFAWSQFHPETLFWE